MSGIAFNTDNTLKDLRAYQYRVSTALADIFTKYAETTTAEMKEGVGVPRHVSTGRRNKGDAKWILIGKPWVDRTGKAKQELKAVYLKEGANKYTLRMQHGVDYGIWLEFANEKKYAIIMPTLRRVQPLLWSDIQRLLKQIQVKK